MLWRMDKYWNEYRRMVPFLEMRPSDYVKRQMWFATQPVEEPDNPADLVTTIKLYDGENRTLFASDWPHHDFDHPRSVLNLPMPPEMKRKIMGENALSLFKIPAPAQKISEQYAVSVMRYQVGHAMHITAYCVLPAAYSPWHCICFAPCVLPPVGTRRKPRMLRVHIVSDRFLPPSL